MKKLFLLLIGVIITFSFCSNVKADCYEFCLNRKCEYAKSCDAYKGIPGGNCVKVYDEKKISEHCPWDTDIGGSEEIKDTEDIKYDNYSSSLVSCGDRLMTNIPYVIPKVISILYTLIQVVVPVVLVIFGMLDLFKGITAGKEDEMKKGQQLFIKRLVSAALVFFVFVFVKLLISFAADANDNRIINCAECFIKNNCTSQGVIK